MGLGLGLGLGLGVRVRVRVRVRVGPEMRRDVLAHRRPEPDALGLRCGLMRVRGDSGEGEGEG